MAEKPEALRLADDLQEQAVWESLYGPSHLRDLLPEAAAELRRLHHENERLKAEFAAEREACAKLAETTICDTHLPTGVRIYGTRVASAIRARSKE